MRPGRGDLERPLGVRLALHVRQIGIRGARCARGGDEPRDGRVTGQVCAHREQ